MAIISVVIPVYNVGRYLRECLESVLAQTFRDIEIIVVDDGSTDESLSIARGFADNDGRVMVFTKPNGGLSSARNFGLSKVSGRFISFVDGDDCLYQDSLEILHEGMIRTGCRIVAGGFVRKQSVKSSRSKRWQRHDAYHANRDLLYQHSLVPTAWGKLYDRSLFENHMFSEGIVYEDLDLMYRLVDEAGELAVTRDVVYFYRPNPLGTTGHFSPQRFDVLDVTRRIEEYMAERHPDLLPAARDRRLSANFNMLGLVAANCQHGEYEDVADSCWRLIREYRFASLADPRVRLKNKLGVMVSYCGRRVFEFFAKRIYS